MIELGVWYALLATNCRNQSSAHKQIPTKLVSESVLPVLHADLQLLGDGHSLGDMVHQCLLLQLALV